MQSHAKILTGMIIGVLIAAFIYFFMIPMLGFFDSRFAKDFYISYDDSGRSEEFRGKGFFDCVQKSGSKPFVQITLDEGKGDRSVFLSLPVDAQAGSFPFSQDSQVGESYLITAWLRIGNKTLWHSKERFISGQITLESMPQDSQRYVEGNFSASFYPRREHSSITTIEGSFKFFSDISLDECH